jgi:hypothetical protein
MSRSVRSTMRAISRIGRALIPFLLTVGAAAYLVS